MGERRFKSEVWNQKKSSDCHVLATLSRFGPLQEVTRWQHRHRVQELIDSGKKVFPLLGLVGHVVEDLVGHDGGDRSTDLVIALNVDLVLTLLQLSISMRII